MQNTIPSFPKILAIGERHIRSIFDEPVEITEKIDGSQFVFGKIGDELVCRSKGKIMPVDAPEKMFQKAVDYILSIQDIMRENFIYFTEFLNKPKHNILSYNRTPKNGLALFGVMLPDREMISFHGTLTAHANVLGIDVVPLLFHGKTQNI